MSKYFYLCLLVLCLAVKANAQKFSFLEKKGKELLADGDYYGASQYFKKALSIDSADVEVQYLCADAHRLNLNYNTAIYWYKKVFKTDRGQKYPLTTFWLGNLYKSTGNYKEAIKQYERYAKKFKKKNTYYTLKSNQEIIACNFALQAIKDTVEIQIIHLDSTVNSVVSEYAPVEYNDTLYFSSLKLADDKKNKTGYNRIYYSSTKNPQQNAQLIDTIINSENVNVGNLTFSSDGKKVFFSKCVKINSSAYGCKIYTSQKEKNGKWSVPTELPESVNQLGASATHPALGFINNKEYLFFSSNRNGTIGGMDIWYIPIDFSEAAKNAGKWVNTLDDDITPFYCSPCKQLYFSSPWHAGLGGFDIFKSDFNDTTFLTPQNMGVPLNSSYNDLYFTINKKQTNAYLASNRVGSFFEKNETCCNDIYQLHLKDEEETPIDSIITPIEDTTQIVVRIDSTLLRINKLRELVPLTLYFHNDEPDSRTTHEVTKKTYSETFFSYLKLKQDYKIEYSKGLKNNQKMEALTSIDAFFEDSVEYGFEQLEKFAGYLKETLQKGDTVIVTMKGYCSPLASSDYNIKLAKRRVNSLANYFKRYDNGFFLPYIERQSANKGILILEEESIGELKAPQNVSDNLKDKRNSVYSPNAAAERKIQIIAVGFK